MNTAGENPDTGHATRSPASWYPDPWRRFEYRFHNGDTWTADVSTNGTRYVDPLGTGSSGAPPAPTQSRRDRIATAAMVLGIVGLTISWIPVLFVVGAICAVLGLIFGIVALRRRKHDNRSFALTGTITGGAGILMVGVGVWTTSIVIDTVDEFENPPPATVEITQCHVVESVLSIEGTIENLGDRTSDYRIVVAVSGDGVTGDRETVITVDDVRPGGVSIFDVPIRRLGRFSPTDQPDCKVDDITGPLPFGLPIDASD